MGAMNASARLAFRSAVTSACCVGFCEGVKGQSCYNYVKEGGRGGGGGTNLLFSLLGFLCFFLPGFEEVLSSFEFDIDL